MASRLLDLPIRPSHPVPAGGVDTGGGSTASVMTGAGGVPAAVAAAAGALFFHLGDLAAGDEIAVSRADGSTVRFRVTRVAEHPKDAFPTAAVYGPVPGAELRLITCSGAFDEGSGHHLSTFVVFAAGRGTR